jgi:tetratricopeptide (TPR) repeat protein
LSHLGLATIYATEGRTNDYIFELDQTVHCDPDNFTAFNNLAWELAANPDPRIRDGARAVTLAEHACELTRHLAKRTIYVGTLAAAYAQAGRFDDAIATAQRACDLAQQNGETAMLQRNRELLARYQAHQTAE